ncbi:MAG: NAD(P)H-hydrate dehydratase [Burkholderiales bacterium]|nr:NAD(P)H-hydrate dehydratase [Burkholderiales bacterium]
MTVQQLDAQTLRDWALPALAQSADKESRGRVLVVAGSREIPGAALLCGTAALRAGAGKLVIAAPASVAVQLGIAMPEARVIGLPENAAGGLDASGVSALRDCAAETAAAVIGPGLVDEAATREFVQALLPLLAHCPVVLDALALEGAGRQPFSQPVVLTPHAGEMAQLTGLAKEDVQRDPQGTALQAARRFNAVVALKGAITFIAAPDGRCWRHEGGNAGLATSGSGDVLAGVVGGLAARGAAPEQACAWGVVLHALAGGRLAARLGPLGYLARELPLEIPALMAAPG